MSVVEVYDGIAYGSAHYGRAYRRAERCCVAGDVEVGIYAATAIHRASIVEREVGQ